MNYDACDDVEIALSMRREMQARKDADSNPCADPSLYCPWGIMGPQDYKDNIGRKPN